jgi:polysaccharide biosynthesis transport protein
MLLACGVAAASTYLAVRDQPPIYQARTTLIVGRAVYDLNPSSNELSLNMQLARFYADIARREQVRRATMDALGLNRLPSYNVALAPNSQLIEIIVADINPLRAQVVANELAEQLVLLTPTASDGQITEHQAFVSQQLNALKNAITETEEEVARREALLLELNSASQIAETQREIESLRSKLSGLQANYAALLATTDRGAANTLTIIEPATLPAAPIGNNRMTVVLLATAIALVIAIGGAYLMEYLDDTIKAPEDAARWLELPSLGAVGRLEGLGYATQLIAAQQPLAPLVDAFRILRTNLEFASVDASLRSLMLTSPGPAEGKSVVLANLAVVMAQAGKKVILVDCDFRRPTQHKIFGLLNSYGLADAMLNTNEPPTAYVQRTALADVGVMTSGKLPPNPAELLGSERMKCVIQELVAAADIVLFDSPPVLAVADAAILATRMAAVLLLVDARRTRTGDARQALERLRHLRVNLLGTVLNRHDSANRYYDYYQSAEPPGPPKSARPKEAAGPLPDQSGSQSVVS